jgi:hypothetical protein
MRIAVARRLKSEIPNPKSQILTRRGISLIEVLISMFVLMIGLMGVAAMFPVGSYYMVKAEQLDRGSAVALAASEELVSRGLLAPSTWRTTAGAPLLATPTPLVAVVIDPLGVAHGVEQGQAANVAVFPRDDQTAAAGTRPVRVTVPDGVTQVMSRAVANMIFTARDDLSFALPTRGDAPANLLFDDVLSSNPPRPLRRQSLGEYSWLVTIGPQYDASGNLVTGRDPRLAHNVSVVVFHKRNPIFPTGNETELSEREVGVRILSTGLGGGEVRLETRDPRELAGIRQGEWIMVFGPHPAGVPALQQRWFLAWYRIVAMDLGFEESPTDVDSRTRIVSLKGPRWPWQPGQSTVNAGLFSGAIAVQTMPMRLESRSPWSIPAPGDVGMPGIAAGAAR